MLNSPRVPRKGEAGPTAEQQAAMAAASLRCRQGMAALQATEVRELLRSWAFNARHEQMPPLGDWRVWAMITGRRNGKNWVMSNWLHSEVAKYPGRTFFIAGRTREDVRKTTVEGGDSGVLAMQDPANPCEYQPGKVQVAWANGSIAHLLTSEEPSGCRGPGYAGGIADELAAWKSVSDRKGGTLWQNIGYATSVKLPEGATPRIVAGTTPRPTESIRKLVAAGRSASPLVALTTGSVFDNAENLSAGFLLALAEEFEDTYLWDQEALGLLITAIEDAILTQDMLNTHRVEMDQVPTLKRIAIGVDPAMKSKKQSDRTGIEAVGLGIDDHLYALENRSLKGTPLAWGTALIECWQHWEPKTEGTCVIVAEDNAGGELIKSNIRGIEGGGAPRIIERTAIKSKSKRASTILRMHEQGKAHIVGRQARLERQLCGFKKDLTWEGDESSPDDADGYVWGGLDLTENRRSSFSEWAGANA